MASGPTPTATVDHLQDLVLHSKDFEAVLLDLTLYSAARLGAPDVALAEAAIGAGLSGALLLDTVGHLRAGKPREHEP